MSHGSAWPSRRELLLGLASLGLAGCTGAGSGPPASSDASAPREASPRPQLADGPSPALLLLSSHSGMYGGGTITVYDDGLATLVERDFSDGERRAKVLLARLPDADREPLRDLVEGPGFRGAESRYQQPSVHDAGLNMLVSGPRRIAVHGEPPDLPPALRDLRARVDAIRDLLIARGDDAFTASAPRILTIYRRWFRARRFSDELTVFANGVLDYRVTTRDVDSGDGDDPDPTVHLEQLPRDTLAALSDALTRPEFITAPSRSHVHADGKKSGTTHFLDHRGPLKTVVPAGHAVPPGIRPVLAALTPLLARASAPPDEPDAPSEPPLP